MEWFIFLAGDLFGKEAIWPIVNHLLENGGFHAEGMEIRNTDPTRQSPSVSFLEFLSRHAPPGTPAVRLEMARFLLKAIKCLEDRLEQTCASSDQDSTTEESVGLNENPVDLLEIDGADLIPHGPAVLGPFENPEFLRFASICLSVAINNHH